MGRHNPASYPEDQVVFNAVSGHRHNGVDSRRVNHTDLQNIGVNTHAQIDTRIGHIIYPLSAQVYSGAGNGSDAFVTIGVIPFASWRVLAVGFQVGAAAASTIAEVVTFGVAVSDIGATDDDYFSKFTQDNGAGKNLTGGDMVMNPLNITDYINPDAPQNAGAHVWAAGSPDGIGVWQNKQARIIGGKKNVTGSTATVLPYVIIEAVITV